MKKVTVLLVMIMFQGAFAQLFNGERSLFYTQKARTYNPGQLGFNANMNFYSKVGDALGTVNTANFEAVNWWLVAGNIVTTYGITDHFDATLGLRLYQDTHYNNEFNLPDDIFLTLRAGSFNFARNRFSQGIMASFRIPTAEVSNYQFAEYSSGAFEFGFLYALSFYVDPYLPERSFNLHFNIGYWNHNESGTEVFDYTNYNEDDSREPLKATRSSSEFRMALAFVFPSGVFDFRTEISGMLFLQDPNRFVYSAEEWAFLTPSIRYHAFEWMSFDLGVDFRLSPADRNNTSGIPEVSSRVDLPPNYPDWKMHLGANLNFNLLAANKTSDLSYQQKEAQKKIEMLESIVEEREKAESVQEEIQNLRKVRQEAEKEIEELKKLLEDD